MMREDVQILLIEDDQVDVQGVKRSFRDAKIANPIHVAKDGVEALEILRGENGHARLPSPNILLLDLNMPRMNGIEFLEEIRKDKALHASIVFVLTTSSAEEDICRAYEHHIAGYIVKPEAGSDFLSALEMLDHYWRVVEFPVAKA